MMFIKYVEQNEKRKYLLVVLALRQNTHRLAAMFPNVAIQACFQSFPGVREA